MSEAETVSSAVDHLNTAKSVLEGRIRPLEEAASRWDAIGDQPVIQVSGDGTAQVTKGSDMAAQFRQAASVPQQELADVESRLTAKNSDLAALPGAGDASGFKYAMRTFNPGEEAGTLAKVTNFFKDPAGYSSGILHGSAAAGSDATGIRQLVTTEGKELWTGAGRVPQRVAIGVGLAGTGLGAYIDKGAWNDVLSNK